MAASDDELAYLQPGFALSSLTVPKLRSILVSHDISYPASAKKPQLIELVEEQVLPQSRKILNARARIKRTSRGITDMPSSQESSTADDDETEMPPPPKPAKTPRGRKSKATLAAEAAAARAQDPTPPTPATVSRSRTPGRRSTVKHQRFSDTEEEPDKIRPSARKTRKSEANLAVTPAHVRIDEPDLPIKSENRVKGSSPFSDDNPFQSGSSPPGDSRRASGSTSRSRKSLGQSKDRRISSNTRRKSTPPRETVDREDGIRVPSRRTFEFPASRFKAEDEDDIQPTEEFTPEEELELVRQRAGQGYSGRELLPPKASRLIRRKQKSSTAAKSTTWGVFIALVGSIAAWYRQEKVNIGYCGIGQTEWSLANYNTNIPVWVKDSLQPECEPCPQHAFCFSDMEVTCEPDFVLKSHPLSLGGLVPLPPTCEPDGEKVRRVKVVADRVVEELRERRAAYECGDEEKLRETQASIIDGTTTQAVEASSVATKLEISEEALKEKFRKMRRKGMSDDEYDALWESALGEIEGRDEIEVIRDGKTHHKTYLTTSLSRLPLTCAVRLSILRLLTRSLPLLSLLTLLALSGIYASHYLTTRRALSAKIPDLVDTVLATLSHQASLHIQAKVSEGFISEGQMRDDVLRKILGRAEREQVWRKVRAVVEGNSNVRVGEREGRAGDYLRVWEWIGKVDEGREKEEAKGLLEGGDGVEGGEGGRNARDRERDLERFRERGSRDEVHSSYY